jgi:hypothetical protein
VPEFTLQGAAYRIYQPKKSWEAAQAYCQQYGLSLPTLYNADHFAAVNAEVRKMLPSEPYWIGLNDRQQAEGTYVWADNSTGALQLAQGVGRGVWNPFCANAPDSGGNAHTVRVDQSNCWDDTVSDSSFICTKPVSDPVQILVRITQLDAATSTTLAAAGRCRRHTSLNVCGTRSDTISICPEPCCRARVAASWT